MIMIMMFLLTLSQNSINTGQRGLKIIFSYKSYTSIPGSISTEMGKKNLDNGRYPKTKDCQDDDPLYVQTLLFVGPGQWSSSSVSDGKTCGRWTLGPQICIMSMYALYSISETITTTE